jgi:hypothetical protein
MPSDTENLNQAVEIIQKLLPLAVVGSDPRSEIDVGRTSCARAFLDSVKGKDAKPWYQEAIGKECLMYATGLGRWIATEQFEWTQHKEPSNDAWLAHVTEIRLGDGRLLEKPDA